MKKNSKKYLIVLTSLITFISILFGMNSTVLAETLSVINTTITRMATIPNVGSGENKCTNIGGLSVASNDSNKRLYVIKSNSGQNKAVLYFYANYDNISDNMDNSNNSNYKVFNINGFAGHANAMALDDNYIYITGWKQSGDSISSTEFENAKNTIVRISRNLIWSKYKGNADGDKKITAKECEIFTAKRLNDSGEYVEYNRSIKSITKYKNNGEFIIGRTQDDNILTFTTAKIENNMFVVSRDSKDIFTVEIDKNTGIGQDIGYSPSNGFFIPRWNDTSKVENTIYWIKLNSLSGENRVYKNDGNSKFRKISVKKVNNTIEKWEVESVAFDNDNDMIVSANVEAKNGEYTDGIFKIRRKTATSGGSYKFLGSNIDK